MRLGVSFLLPLVAPTPGGKAKSGGSCSRPTNNDSARDNKYRERRASCQKRGSWHESHDHVSELLEFLRLPGRLLSSLDAVLFFFFLFGFLWLVVWLLPGAAAVLRRACSGRRRRPQRLFLLSPALPTRPDLRTCS